MTIVIGIAGRIKSGKDTFAQFLKTELKQLGYQATIMYFAGRLKEAAKFIYHLEDKDVYTQEGKQSTIPGLGITVRHVLLKLGTEVGRAVHPETWVWNLMKEVNKIDQASKGSLNFVLVPDLRFQNEFKAVTKTGLVFKVLRPSQKPVNPWHQSEWDLEPYPYFGNWFNPWHYFRWLKRFAGRRFRRLVLDWDGIIINDTLQDLRNQAAVVAADLVNTYKTKRAA